MSLQFSFLLFLFFLSFFFPFLSSFQLKLERNGVPPRDHLLHLKLIGGYLKEGARFFFPPSKIRTGLTLKFVPFSSWTETEPPTYRWSLGATTLAAGVPKATVWQVICVPGGVHNQKRTAPIWFSSCCAWAVAGKAYLPGARFV